MVAEFKTALAASTPGGNGGLMDIPPPVTADTHRWVINWARPIITVIAIVAIIAIVCRRGFTH
jgi:hypothetical protein